MLSGNDLLVMSYFRKDARRNLTRISRDTGIPVSTLFDKLKKYEGNVIKKFTSLLDFQKLGFDVRLTLMVKANKENKENIKEFLLKHQRINSVYKINNGYDFLIEAVFRQMQECQEFLDSLDKLNIAERKEYYILDDIKREAFLSDPMLIKSIGI